MFGFLRSRASPRNSTTCALVQALEPRSHFAVTPLGFGTPGASISGVVYLDQNRDGFKQFNEPLLKDVVVYIDLNRDGRRNASEPAVATNVLGQYGFSGLASGTYVLRQETPTGLMPTNPTNGAHTQTIQAGHTRSNINFALGPLPPGPEIDIIGTGDREILNNANAPSKANGTDFGKVSVTSGSRPREFLIENPGDQPLVLGKGLIKIAGPHKGDFRVTRQPPRVIPPKSRVTIRILFDPTAAGRRSATVMIASNDLNEATYRFAISGVGK